MTGQEHPAASGEAGWIDVRGARTHNLRGVDVRLPKGRIVAFTGVSGSGKSSLAIDTVHAEAQLRYLEGLSPFVRQFITPRDRPQVEAITGLPATLAIDQRRANRSALSTVATITGLDDLLSLVFSRVPPLAPGWRERHGADPTSAHFRRFSPEGACPRCKGAGHFARADAQAVITDPARPLLEGASPWFTSRLSPERSLIPSLARHFGTDLGLPWAQQPAAFRDAVLHGTGDEAIEIDVTATLKKSGAEVRVQQQHRLRGALADIERLYAAADTFSGKERYEPFLRTSTCPECEGTGYGPLPRATVLAGQRFFEVLRRPAGEALAWAQALPGQLSAAQLQVAEALLPDLAGRLRLLGELGMAHVQLDRPAPSLSGGELQRARLASQLSTGLSGIAFVLDEPSAGLHPADKTSLHAILRRLREAGNTVLLVEHDIPLIEQADIVVDIGPGAGSQGGRLVAAGTPQQVAAEPASVTGRYLGGCGPRVSRPRRAPQPGNELILRQIRVHNVDLDEVRVPLGVLTCITGVSGSGKSSLLHEAIGAGVAAALEGRTAPGVAAAAGVQKLRWVTVVDQNPIGRTPRSNPATFLKIFDAVRAEFAATPAARAAGLKASHFSFNSPGGRCEACTGYGRRLVDMHFLPDMWVTCEECQGRRFQEPVLAVRHQGLSIDEVLALSVAQARQVFARPAIRGALDALTQTGLSYLQLGQSSTQLSGGEAQRLKLAAAILRAGRDGGGLVVLDEPVTGLHPADVQQMVDAFGTLLQAGNTVVIAEHDLHVAAVADWVLDMGPGAGPRGGQLVGQGPPGLIAAGSGATARYLRQILEPGREPAPTLA